MKRTKLFTSLAGLALVLGLGACEVTEEETTPSESESTSQSSESDTTPGETTPTEATAYALVGDFVDSEWNNAPATDSIYYIAAETTHYEVTVTIKNEPDYGVDENGDPNPSWAAGLRVVNYDTWDLALGYDDLAEGSESSLYGDNEKNIKVEWGETYDIVLTLGEPNSILVTVHEEEVTTTPAPEAGEYFLGFEYNGTTYYIDGTTQAAGNYRGEVKSEIGYAVPVTLAAADGDNAYYLTFELDSTTYYVCIINTGSHINLQYLTTATPIYWDKINGVWVNEEGTYFLCYNSTYSCAYASDFDSYWGTSPIGELLEIPTGWEPLEPEEEQLPDGAISTTITYTTIMGLDQFSGTTWASGSQTNFSSAKGTITPFNGFSISWYAGSGANGCAIYDGSSLRIYYGAHFDISAASGYEIYSTEVYTSSNGSYLGCTGANDASYNSGAYTWTTGGQSDISNPIVYTNTSVSGNTKTITIGYITVIAVPAVA